MRIATRLATKIGAVALLAGGITVTTATTSQAIFNAEQTQHIIDCARWLLTDPETHAANCLPSRVAPSNRSLSEPVTSTIIGPPKVTPPKEDDPPPPSCEVEAVSYGHGSNDECGGEEPPPPPPKDSHKDSDKYDSDKRDSDKKDSGKKDSKKDSDKRDSSKKDSDKKDSGKKDSKKDSDKKDSDKRGGGRR